MTRPRRPARGRVLVTLGVALGLLVAVALAAVGVLEWRVGAPPATPAPANSAPPDPALAERGAYLARAGNCAHCHTARGGAPYAGGRAIVTPFGTVLSRNLTPDAASGLGAWSEQEFERALRHGVARDGRVLSPACPYPNFNLLGRDEVHALWAHLRRQPAVATEPQAPTLRFPYRLQAALAAWRWMFFDPTRAEREAQAPAAVRAAGAGAAWRRGRLLVQGLGHCGACHAPRNAWGAVRQEEALPGGLMPQGDWWAPALNDGREAGLADWPRADAVALLRDGSSARGATLGPMAEVVLHSTSHLDEADLQAMAVYLQALPPADTAPAGAPEPAEPATLQLGAKLYEAHCAGCHGAQGEGVPGLYRPLAGNRALTQARPNNVVLAIRHGGFAPSTPGHPRPFGMPPFGERLNDEQIAALATYLRQSWGHRASAVSALEVLRLR